MTTDEKPQPLYLAPSRNISVPAAPELLEEAAVGPPDTIDRLEASVRELKAALEMSAMNRMNALRLCDEREGMLKRAEARCAALAKDVDAGAAECDALRRLATAAKRETEHAWERIAANVAERDALRARVVVLEDTLRLTGEQLDVIYSAGHGADVLYAVQRAQQLVQAAVKP